MSLYGCTALWEEPQIPGFTNENENVYAQSFPGEEIVTL
jgi:hypothetical protein